MTQSAEATAGQVTASAEPLCTTLPVPDSVAFEMFCDAERLPEWLGVIRLARVQRRDAAGRPQRVAFLALLRGGTIGYSLDYRYDEAAREVSWQTQPGTAMHIAGKARFTALGEKASLMSYELVLDGPCGGALPAWADSSYQCHAASTVLASFRDWVKRQAD